MNKQTLDIKVEPFLPKPKTSHNGAKRAPLKQPKLKRVGAIKSCGWTKTQCRHPRGADAAAWLRVSLQQFRVHSPPLACGMYTSTCLSLCGVHLMQRLVWCCRINKPSEIANSYAGNGTANTSHPFLMEPGRPNGLLEEPLVLFRSSTSND